MCPEDVADLQTPVMQEIAKDHNCHPAIIALKWARQRGEIAIPFSLHNYVSNLKAMTRRSADRRRDGEDRNTRKRKPPCKRTGVLVAWSKRLA